MISQHREKTLKSHPFRSAQIRLKNRDTSGSFMNFLAKQEGIAYSKEASSQTPPRWRPGSVLLVMSSIMTKTATFHISTK